MNNTEQLIKKLIKIRDLMKGLSLPKIKQNFMDVKTPVAPNMNLDPKTPSMTPSSKKDPIKVAEQLKDSGVRDLKIDQAKQQKKSMKNAMAFKTESTENKSDLYDAYDIENQRLNSSPAFAKDLKKKYGKSVVLKRHIPKKD